MKGMEDWLVEEGNEEERNIGGALKGGILSEGVWVEVECVGEVGEKVCEYYLAINLPLPTAGEVITDRDE